MNDETAGAESSQTFRDLRVPLICALLLAATFTVYWRALDNGFLTFFDDGAYITSNPHVQAGINGSSISWAFRAMRCANWHPLTWVSHMADCSLYRLTPSGHHLTSILIHAATTLLLFLLLKRMTGFMWRCAFVAVLFAIHPLHVESVAWISERKDVLSAFFWVLTMLAYAWYAEKPGWKRYSLVMLAFALGLLSKPMLVTLPFVLLLLDYWPLRRDNRQQKGLGKLIVEKIPLFVLSVASGIVTFIAQRQSLAVGSLDEMGMGMRVSNALVAYVSYIGKAMWPAKLGAFYPYSMHPFPAWQVAGAALCLIAVTVLSFRYGREHRYLPVGWLWYLGTLIPVIGLVQVGAQAMADRYTYIPLVGVFVMVAWGVPDVVRMVKWSDGQMVETSPTARHALSALAVTVVVALMVRAHDQTKYWRDNVILLRHAVEITTDNYPAHLLLGNTLAADGKYDSAIEQYRLALKITPEYALAHDGLGAVLASQGRLDEAEVECREAVRLYPGYADSHYHLGMVLSRRKEWAEAAAEYEAAIHLQPDNANAHNNLGNVYLNEGDLKNAIAEYRKALRLDPGLTQAQVSLDAALHSGDDASRFRESVHHYNAGVALQNQDKTDAAIREYKQALQARPEFAQAHINLALAYYEADKFSEAWKEVHLCRKYGAEPHPGFIKALAEEMPEPQR